MATTARDEIIAEWRKRLADAEEPLSTDSPRTVWLMRVRLRLYRFLLSLYGDGRWNASETTNESSPNAEPIVVNEQALPLAGKPAKDEQQIRAVLKSVACASDSNAMPGPLASGVARHDQKSNSRHSERAGTLVRNLCLAAMVASVCVLFSVSVTSAMGLTFSRYPSLQSFTGQIVVLALACFVTSAMVFVIFAKWPRS